MVVPASGARGVSVVCAQASRSAAQQREASGSASKDSRGGASRGSPRFSQGARGPTRARTRPPPPLPRLRLPAARPVPRPGARSLSTRSRPRPVPGGSAWPCAPRAQRCSSPRFPRGVPSGAPTAFPRTLPPAGPSPADAGSGILAPAPPPGASRAASCLKQGQTLGALGQRMPLRARRGPFCLLRDARFPPWPP